MAEPSSQAAAGSGPAVAGPEKRYRRPTTGLAQAKRQAWGRFWGPALAQIGRQVRDENQVSANPYAMGQSQATASWQNVSNRVQELQTILSGLLTELNQLRADIAQLEQQAQTPQVVTP